MVQPMIYRIREVEELLDDFGIPANLSLVYRIKSLIKNKDAKIEAQGERIKQLEGLLDESFEWLDDVCFPSCEIANPYGVAFRQKVLEALGRPEALQEGIHDDCPLDDYVEEEANVD